MHGARLKKMKTTYKVLLVGLGNIAMGYDIDRDDICWTHLKAIMSHPEFDILAGVDPNQSKRDLFSEISGVSAFSTMQQFCRESHINVDLVVIASPTEFHLEDYQLANNLNPKLVLMEKPLVAEVEEIISLEKYVQQGAPIQVNLFRLYQKSLNLKLDELKQSGYCKIKVSYSGSILNNGIHFITLLESHFGRCHERTGGKFNDEKMLSIKFENASLLMSESYPRMDDNSMIVQSSLGTLYYLNGGRISFFVDKNHNQEFLDLNEFNHYMLCVYDKCFSILNGGLDNSFELAISGHNILLGSENNHG